MFALFKAHSANLVRARQWHNPTWTNYSTLDDAKKTFTRAQEAGMGTLLDSHHVVADATLYSWTGSEWRESSFTGGMAIEGGALSVIEFQIRTGELGNPALLNIAVLSPGRVLTRTAADVLGSDVTPRESTDAGIVSSFAHTELTSE